MSDPVRAGFSIPNNTQRKKLQCVRCGRQVRMQRRPRQNGEPARDTWVEADALDGRPHDCRHPASNVPIAVKEEDRKDRAVELRPSKKDDRQKYGRPLSDVDRLVEIQGGGKE